MTSRVFASEETHLDLWPAGRVDYWPQVISGDAADELAIRLKTQLDWRQLPVRLFGRSIPQPRLTAFYGEPGVTYRYSGLTLNARAWTQDLGWLRDLLERRTGGRFNSVLCNLYRDGKDYMGWHADDEAELGSDPVIASLSLGAQRRFVLKPKDGQASRIEFRLAPGSLLVMRGDLQDHWLHQLPRALRVKEARINLTFRQITGFD